MKPRQILKEVFTRYRAGEFSYFTDTAFVQWDIIPPDEPLFYGLCHPIYLAVHRGHYIEVHHSRSANKIYTKDSEHWEVVYETEELCCVSGAVIP